MGHPAEVVERFWRDVWSEGRADLVSELFAEDAKENGEPLDLEQFANAVARWKQIFPDFTAAIQESIPVDEQRVLTRVTYSGTQTETWAGLPANNDRFEVVGLDLFTVIDGKITELWHAVDHYDMAYQLGGRLTPAVDRHDG